MRKAKQQVLQLTKWIREQAVNNPIISLLVIVLLGGFIWMVWATYKADNLGFDQTLWEWMRLLLVPLVVGLGIGLLNYSQRRNEREIALDKQHQTTLETYFDRMSELILDKGEKKGVRDIARTRTLTVLRSLDAKRVEAVFRFMDDSGLKEVVPLIGGNLRGVKWEEANLSRANLRGADLSEANLFGANLFGADLSVANLFGANLSNANLSRANLRGAYLRGAYLSEAVLYDANLFGAVLSEAVLYDANLSDANLSEARNYTDKQLLEAKSLKGATMPDGTKYEEWVKRISEESRPQSQEADEQLTADDQSTE